MTEALARYFVRPLLARHPLPWRIERDWSIELYDAKDQIVMKFMHVDHANELIAFATALEAYDLQGAKGAAALLHGVGCRTINTGCDGDCDCGFA